MEVSRIIAEIDLQIAKLQQARELLSGTQPVRAGRGRPKGSKNATPATAAAARTGQAEAQAKPRRT